MTLPKALFWRTFFGPDVVLWWWLECCCCECSIPPTGSLFLIFSLFIFFLAVCILDVFLHLVGAEAGCNWYLSILIYSLYQKKNMLRSIEFMSRFYYQSDNENKKNTVSQNVVSYVLFFFKPSVICSLEDNVDWESMIWRLKHCLNFLPRMGRGRMFHKINIL